jgi:flagellar motility protein MotE (MotC chaperone)
MHELAAVALIALAQVAPKPPAEPKVTEPKAPVATESAPAVDPGGLPRSPRAESRGASAPAANLPPSLTAEALKDELQRAGKNGHAASVRAEAERAKLDAEREALKALAAQIEQARRDLREETQRLEAATHAASAKPVPSPAASVKGRPSLEPGATPSPEVVKNLSKTLGGMKPEQAAAMLEHLEPSLAQELFRHIRPGDASPIVERLKPEVAARLFTGVAAASATGARR